MSTGSAERSPGSRSFDLTRLSVISSDGTPINCLSTGIEAGRPGLMIALPFGVPAEISGAAFAALAPHFNLVTWESRHVLALDHPFRGDEAMGPEAHVADILAILAALGMRLCDLIGYCSGAGISLLAASLHPEVFTNLVLVNGEYQLFRRGHEATPYQRSIDAFLPEASEGREQAAAMFRTMTEISSASRGGSPQSEFDRLFNTPFSSAEHLFRYARNYMAYRDFDAASLASEIRQPTVVIMGGQDAHAGMENSEAVCRAIGGARACVDEAGDHYAFCRGGSHTLELVAAALERRG